MTITINGSGDINATSNDIKLNSTGTTDVTLAVGGGSVGVGTVSPAATLDVNGTIKLDGNHPVGTGNVALGDTALDSNVSGNYNTAIGANALTANTANNNVSVGYGSLLSNTTGTANTATGTGVYGVSAASLQSNTTGSYNTAFGNGALASNSTASNNTAVGYQAGYTNSTGLYSSYFGFQSGYLATGTGNTFIGYQAGYNSTGTLNTFVGNSNGAGNLVTTGSKNTILGGYNGNQGGVDTRTASNHIVLSDGDGNPRLVIDGNGHSRLSTAQGSMALSGNQHITFNNYNTNYIQSFEHGGGTGPFGLNIEYTDLAPNTNGNGFLACQDISAVRLIIYSNGNVVNQNNSYGAISDEKLKENIVDSGSQWDDIKALRVRKYSLKADELDAPNKLGVVAQELEAVGMAGLVIESPDLDKDNNDLGTITKSVNYSILYMKAVKALQEAMERIETLEAKVQALESA